MEGRHYYIYETMSGVRRPLGPLSATDAKYCASGACYPIWGSTKRSEPHRKSQPIRAWDAVIWVTGHHRSIQSFADHIKKSLPPGGGNVPVRVGDGVPFGGLGLC